ncbi:MAG: hypothetical protein ACYCZW_00835 [Minisyncoccota bacterium]
MKKISLLNRQGFIGTFILIIIALVTLQFAFKVDVLSILQSPQLQVISNFVIKWALIIWHWFVGIYQSIKG